MKYEVTCANKGCAYRPPTGMEHCGPYRQLVELESLMRLPDARCKACKEPALRLLQVANDNSQKFPLGRIELSPGVIKVVTPQMLAEALSRHRSGDWGDLSVSDKLTNEMGLEESSGIPNDVLVSLYKGSVELLVITERGRQQTSILLPEER